MALLQLGKEAVPGLIACLESDDTVARGTVVEILGQLGDKRALEPLLEELKKGKVWPGAVANALARIGDRRAVAFLMEILLKRDKDSLDVVEAVRKLTKQWFGLDDDLPVEEQKEAFNRWEKWWQANRKKYEK